MDDLKFYAKKENDLEYLISTVHLFSVSILMTINLNKNARIVVSRGKVIRTFGVDIEDVDVAVGYKYLGVLQDFSISHNTIKDKHVKEYRSRLCAVLSSQLNG